MAKIGVIPGDGVGPEVIREALAVLGDLNSSHNLDLEVVSYPLGGSFYISHGVALPQSVREDLATCDAFLLGAVGHPDVAPGILERGLLLELRFGFQQYINLRPVKLYEGVPTPLSTATVETVDLVVVRENNEDLYVGMGGVSRLGTAEEVATQTSLHTRAGVERCLRFAFETARSRARDRVFHGLSQSARGNGLRGRLTLVAKTNVLTYSGDLWIRTRDVIAAEYPEIELEYQHVDAACMHLVRTPERFDVIATTNMFGDILTDLGAVLQGGMGVAASGNLNPERNWPSMFEPVHGSAPDIAGQGKANPIAAILSIGLMLDHLGHEPAAEVLRGAVASVLRDPSRRTADLGGTATTEQVGTAVREALAIVEGPTPNRPGIRPQSVSQSTPTTTQETP